MQIAIYARVSTGRQAENDLSIPDQLRQMRAWAERNGHVVVKEYVEPGASATDDKRPVFQDMMFEAGQKPMPFQLVIVHSFSRFFRDHIEGAIYQRRLRKYGIRVESITQQTNDDPSGQMHRSMIMLFDEYQSKENAKHTLRGMQENARQGYFNGSRAPFGYQTVSAGQTGSRGRIKKKLAVLEDEAEVVREIFELYVNGKTDTPRMGMKKIAKTLNAQGCRIRGQLWGLQAIHRILSSTTYVGTHVFNRMDSKSLKEKAESEWIKIAVPAIVDQEIFDKAAKLRSAYTALRSSPSREASPNLLTGLLKCSCCGGTMVKQTAKSNQYAYYKCSSRISKGPEACQSRNYPMDKLDRLVLDAFREKIYTPEYIFNVIKELREGLAKRGGEEKLRLKKLDSELKTIDQAENKLYEAIEKGVIDLDEKLKERLASHKARREEVEEELEAIRQKHQTPLQTLTPQKIKAVARFLRKRFTESSAFSRAYLKATVSEIRVNKDVLNLVGESKGLSLKEWGTGKRLLR